MYFEDARKAMVDSQLAPNGITDSKILDAFSTLPRELFLPDAYQRTCYKDEDINLPNGRAVLDPLTLAKLISAADIQEHDVILCIGDISGYAAAILSKLATTIIRLEEDHHALSFSEEIYENADIINIVSIQQKLSDGDMAHAPFNKIILCGASTLKPQHLIKQLSDDGALCYVHKNNPMTLGAIKKIKKVGASEHIEETIGMSATAYCLGYESEKAFAL
ncbi:MAG: hypothetical protein JKY11_05650 [Alphaproteobacteria bacterium]|nr:hypothetical protein [Alphaproteobacteria bacterium]